MRERYSLILSLVALWTTAVYAQPLEDRADLVTGTLENGLTYMVLQHDNPPDRAATFMHVSSGSLNETDEQRGIAHFLEHMAFNGSENFDKNDVIDFFQSIGLTFGQHQNAFTSFDQTTYTLELPDAEPETLDKAFLFFSDVAFGLKLDPEQIESERPIILEEKRTSAGPQMRVQEYIFENIAPGSRFGERLPIGTEETIKSVDRDDFVDYYESWYTPSNITVMVVADADPEMVVDRIRANFSRGERVPRPEDLDAGVQPYSKMRGIVASDGELRDAEVSIVRIVEPAPPVRTEQRFRESLVENMATVAFNRRLEAKINEGEMRFLRGSAFSRDLFEAFRVSQVSASGEPAVWREMLRDLALELQRARLHGFSDREMEAVRAQVHAAAERAVEQEPTQPARQILQRLNGVVAEGEPFLSAERRLELVEEYADGITREEISARFAELFDTRAVTFIATLPASADLPTEEELVSLGREAVSVTPEADEEVEAATSLMTELPEPGAMSEPILHEATEVRTVELDNGAVVHHRFMDYRKGSATITISLAGGELLEPADQKGVTQAAVLAWQRPATSEITSTQIRDLMTGKKVSVSGAAGRDSLALTVSGNPGELEVGMQLAHLLLTDPVVEEAAFDQWKRSTLQQIDARKLQPFGVIQEVIPETIAPGEHRLRPLEKSDVETLSREQAQWWLEKLLSRSPIEVSVVGDIDRERAFELVARYVGSLPARDRIAPYAFAAKRRIERPEGPLVGRREVETQTPMGVVVSGFFGADQSDMHDRRYLSAAARVLSTRMIKRIREQEQLVYSIGAQSQPGIAYPGYGLFFSAAPTQPAAVDRLASVIEEMFRAFAEEGPTPEEVDVVRGQIANRLDEQLKEPGFWTNILSDHVYHDRSLDEIAGVEAWYEAIEAEEMRRVFAKYFAPERRVTIIVAPTRGE